MTDDANTEDDGQNDDGNTDIRALRQAAKERNDLAKQLAASQRELAFAKSGLDFADPKLKYFVNGYDGELTSEAIRQRAQEDGFLAPPPDTTSQEEVNSHQRMANASSGAGDGKQPDFLDKVRQANNQDEVMKLVMEQGLPTSWNRPE